MLSTVNYQEDILWTPQPWMKGLTNLLQCLVFFFLWYSVVAHVSQYRSVNTLHAFIQSKRFSIVSNCFPTVTIPWTLFPYFTTKFFPQLSILFIDIHIACRQLNRLLRLSSKLPSIKMVHLISPFYLHRSSLSVEVTGETTHLQFKLDLLPSVSMFTIHAFRNVQISHFYAHLPRPQQDGSEDPAESRVDSAAYATSLEPALQQASGFSLSSTLNPFRILWVTLKHYVAAPAHSMDVPMSPLMARRKTASVFAMLPNRLNEWMLAPQSAYYTLKQSVEMQRLDTGLKQQCDIQLAPCTREDASIVLPNAVGLSESHQELDEKRIPYVLLLQDKTSSPKSCFILLVYGRQEHQHFQVERVKQLLVDENHCWEMEEIYGSATSNTALNEASPEQTGLQDVYKPTQLCVICLCDPAKITILPCRHCCVCVDCWYGSPESNEPVREDMQVLEQNASLSACPVCRSTVRSWVTLHSDQQEPEQVEGVSVEGPSRI